MVLSLLNRFCNLITSKSEWIRDLILFLLFHLLEINICFCYSKCERHNINFHEIMDIVLMGIIIHIFTLGHNNMSKWYCYLSFYYITRVLCCLCKRHDISTSYIVCIITFSDLLYVILIPITKLFIA